MEDKGGMFHYFATIVEVLLEMGYKIHAILLTTDEHLLNLPSHENLNIDFVRVTKKSLLLYKLFSQNIDKKISNKILESSIKTWVIIWDSYFLVHIPKDESLKIAYVVHDVFPHEAAGFKKLATKILYHRSKEKRKSFPVLITNSLFQYNLLKNLYPRKDIFYFPMPSSVTKTIELGTKKVPEIDGISDYFLFFGRLEPYKGVENLLKAFSDCSSTRKLVIAGNGRLNISQGILNKNIIFINRFIEDSEIKDLFEKAFCVVFPYKNATQVGPISIAYYFRKPVIISAIPALMEKFDFKRPEGILVSKDDIFSLSYALNLMEIDDLRKQFEENCKTAYSKYYSPSDLMERLNELFLEVMIK
jgi:glycosyltransferase involved in cell wall biosynthesis